MRVRSHRWRLTLWAVSIVGALLAMILFGAYLLLGRLQADAADDMLASVLRQVEVSPEQNGEWHDPEELASLYPGLSVAVFANGRLTTSYGAHLPLVRGEGLTTVAGRTLRYREIQRDGRVVIAAVDWQDQASDQRRMLLAFALIWPVTVGLVGFVAWAAAGATFRPLLRMATQAESMAAEAGSRLPVPKDQEFGHLASRLNGFLDRLESNVKAQERFASDAAHEMRTPLTVIRGHFETALMRKRTVGDYEEVLRLGVAETERLSGLVDLLLESATSQRPPPEPIDIEHVLREVHARWVGRFAYADVNLDLEVQATRAAIWESELVCLLDNLLANALRFSPRGSTCRIIGREEGSRVEVEVCDEGKGVPAMDAERIFERFLRLDDGRSRDAGGFGIGLAVCRVVVERRGGSIGVTQNSPSGAKFTFKLPLACKSTLVSIPEKTK